MKLRCHRPSLTNAFQLAAAVVPSRTPKDVLKQVKLEATSEAVNLVGTDQEVGLRCAVPGVELEGEGDSLLPTAQLQAILREITDESVEFDISDEAVEVSSGSSNFKLSVGDPLEYPQVATLESEAYYVVKAKDLRNLVQRTIFAVDTESTRYALGGVLLNVSDGKITFAATDSRRLAVAEAECGSEGEVEASDADPVVPTKALSLLEKSLGDLEDDIHICWRANEILFRSGDATIYSRLVEGRFPRYRDVIPAESTVSVDLVAGPLLSAVRQAQIVTSEESRGVDFEFSSGLLRLKSRAADVGQSHIELPVPYEGDELRITFDPRFIADFLRILDAESQVKLDLIDSENAAVFRASETYTYVVMPLAREG